MHLHGSSLPPSDKAANISFILSSKKAKPSMVSLRHHRMMAKKIIQSRIGDCFIGCFVLDKLLQQFQVLWGSRKCRWADEPCFQVVFDHETLNYQSPESSRGVGLRRNWDCYKYIFKQFISLDI